MLETLNKNKNIFFIYILKFISKKWEMNEVLRFQRWFYLYIVDAYLLIRLLVMRTLNNDPTFN